MKEGREREGGEKGREVREGRKKGKEVAHL
jgi:hypothetical protein